MDRIEHFDYMVSKGFEVIPVHPGTKRPRLRRWQDVRYSSPEMRSLFERFPDSNLGLRLGEIVDVEGDTASANRKIAELIGDYRHPQYTSRRSSHHLFLSPDPDLRLQKKDGIEFRGHGHQSLLPPSSHAGVSYVWIDDAGFKIPAMPPRLLSYLRSISKKRRRHIKPGHIACWCSTCGDRSVLHKKRWKLELSSFASLGEKWQCRSCRTVDLREACRALRRQS